MYGAITIFSLTLIALLVFLYRKPLFSDRNNIKVILMIFVFLPILIIGIVIAALF
ncbi:hypothetical protein [Halobacillus litoralis]|uniref:hypothetical protein n=1 Tax=Halobacillus litoralis TaxID=45668 RepID=UPI001CFF0076|nr:hypothetical protein [Halobacillus litoralis]